MNWLCPYDGVDLVARTAPFAGQQRQCPTCAKRWDLDGNPIPRSGDHNKRAVKIS